MIKKTTLRDFGGRIQGYIEENTTTGEKIGRDFYGRIVGYYNPKQDVTTDFYRRIIGRGDMLASLVITENNKNLSRK